MADLKPIGSEKLQGDEKIKRILELTYFDTNKNTASKNAEFISESNSGVFGIVKEKDGYYVKKGLNENTLDYIGGMFMKNKNRFSAYGDAFKRLELLQGQENLNEDTRYVLKSKSTPTESLPPKPEMDAKPAPPSFAPAAPLATPDAGMEPSSETSPETPDMGGEETPDEFGGAGMGGESLDPIKKIQKTTGELGELIHSNDQKIEKDDVKYVVNSVLAAFGKKLFDLDEKDKDEILGHFDPEKSGEEENGDDFSSTEMGDDVNNETSDYDTTPNSFNDREMGEAMNSLEELINTPLNDESYGDGNYDTDEYATEYEDEPESEVDSQQGQYQWNFPDVEDDYFKGGEFDELGNEDQDVEIEDDQPRSHHRQYNDETEEEFLREALDKTIKETLSKYFK